MRYLVLFLLLCLAPGWSAPRPLVFERNGTIWVARSDGSQARKLCDGSFPALSPDGTRVAFERMQAKGNEISRYLMIIPVTGGKPSSVPGVGLGTLPAWSPDGSRLLFTNLKDNGVAVVNPDGTGYALVAKDCSTACWAPDSQSIYAQDFTSLQQWGLDGRVQKSWNLAKLLPGWQLDSSSGLAMSVDGKLLVEARKGEEPNVQASIWMVDLVSGQGHREVSGYKPCWEGSQSFLYTDKGNIYRRRVGGPGRTLVIKAAAYPATAAP